MNINGIWRGEFVVVQQNIQAIPVPFVLRIQSQSQSLLISDSCLFSGTWRMYRTFRKIQGRVSELKGMRGTWWMEKA